METKNIILELRTKNHMSQDDLAERGMEMEIKTST